jgi:glycosyltransferase involved in cell wall biosynthesis
MIYKKAIVSVTSDLVTDQRVDRTCRTLVKMGYEVMLVGRRKIKSLPVTSRGYQTRRMVLLFEKGPLFYAEFNIRLFLLLLTNRADLLVSNDLDTLPANYFAQKWLRWFGNGKGTKLVHDCHEYYRGVPELVGRKRVIAIWKWLEDITFPHIEKIYAVNGSIAGIYEKEYGKTIGVIRNVPDRKWPSAAIDRSRLGIGPEQKVILYQGAVNVDRGLEEAIDAMEFMNQDAVFLILGTGDLFDELKEKVTKKGMEKRVILAGAIPLESLHSYTLLGDIGLSIEKNVCINYYYALPNKFMDYIQAHVPVLVSPFPEMKAIVEKYRIGTFIGSHDPRELAASIGRILGDREQLTEYRKNMSVAAAELCWENEEEKLKRIFSEATGT